MRARSASSTDEPAATRVKQEPLEEQFSNNRTFRFPSDAARNQFKMMFPYQTGLRVHAAPPDQRAEILHDSHSSIKKMGSA